MSLLLQCHSTYLRLHLEGHGLLFLPALLLCFWQRFHIKRVDIYLLLNLRKIVWIPLASILWVIVHHISWLFLKVLLSLLLWYFFIYYRLLWILWHILCHHYHFIMRIFRVRRKCLIFDKLIFIFYIWQLLLRFNKILILLTCYHHARKFTLCIFTILL